MRTLEAAPQMSGQNLEDVRQAAALLKGQACSFAARNISDGMSRLLFNRKVAYFTQGVIKEVENGRSSAKSGLEKLKDQLSQLLDASEDIGRKVVGIAGGTSQVTTGAQICYSSVGTLCLFFGVPLIAHGSNNIYENTRNLIENRSDVEGPLKKAYQDLFVWAGSTARHGNMTYYHVDLALSGYGLIRKVPNPEAIKLWYNFKSDFFMNYKNLSKSALLLEGAADVITLDSLYNEWKKGDE
ncbi:DUF4225 domain-containing protein [Pseudomonas sp. 21LCFQ010]|uniref:DUF4225 domain-containing protein n=1 Tax=Pseudomonas sp. 21LCFQ010 TaxID=2957506 RepID=UPI0020984D7D|nr:DUF4225 domain-containing protein [Pseudomonas sp. 21LCFQ010]MCO8162971.1 DUF4225 domain-containing protein [Pseudomonas sp. 21LCFQ010]